MRNKLTFEQKSEETHHQCLQLPTKHIGTKQINEALLS